MARVPLVLPLLLAAGACASPSARAVDPLESFRAGNFRGAIAAFGDPRATGSAFLSGTEAGTVALAGGDWDLALAYFRRAAAVSAQIEKVGEVPGEAGDNFAGRHVGSALERVQLHCALALTHLALGELEAVEAETDLAKRLLVAEEALRGKRYAAGGFGHFIAAIAHELRGESRRAYDDYARMLERGVGEGIAGKALVRLGERLGFGGELTARFGAPAELPPDVASVIVVAAIGLGPFQEDGGPPGLTARPNPISGLRFLLGEGGASLLTTELESVGELAILNLADRTATATLQVPDSRHWQTLPNSWQACRLWLRPGVHSLRLEAIGGDSADLGRFEILPGETVVVLARTVDTHLRAHVIGGVAAEAELTETP